jgi:hypothetical protein
VDAATAVGGASLAEGRLEPRAQPLAGRRRGATSLPPAAHLICVECDLARATVKDGLDCRCSPRRERGPDLPGPPIHEVGACHALSAGPIAAAR